MKALRLLTIVLLLSGTVILRDIDGDIEGYVKEAGGVISVYDAHWQLRYRIRKEGSKCIARTPSQKKLYEVPCDVDMNMLRVEGIDGD